MKSESETTPPTTIIEQLQTIKSILDPKNEESLQNKSIMIPMTSKAFIQGHLTPTTTTTTTTAKEEVILLKDKNNNFIEMNRYTACTELQKRINKKKHVTIQTKSKTTKTPSNIVTNTKQPPNDPSSHHHYVPYIEIREEFDKFGNPVKNEVINMPNAF